MANPLVVERIREDVTLPLVTLHPPREVLFGSDVVRLAAVSARMGQDEVAAKVGVELPRFSGQGG